MWLEYGGPLNTEHLPTTTKLSVLLVWRLLEALNPHYIETAAAAAAGVMAFASPDCPLSRRDCLCRWFDGLWEALYAHVSLFVVCL